MNAMINELSAGMVFMGASFLIQSTLLILVALLVARRFAHRAALRNAIFRATLVAVILCAPLCYAFGRAGVSFLRVTLPRPEAVAAAPLTAAPSVTNRVILPTATEAAVVVPEAPDVPVLAGETKSALTADSVYVGLAALWGAGCACMLGYLALCHWLVIRTRKRGTIVAESAIIERLGEICARLNVRQPALIVSDSAKSPMLIGLRSPAIVIPKSHKEELLAGRLDSVLIHELAHLARYDCAWNLFSRLACSVAFFHPLVWVLARRIEDASDEVADDYVLAHGGDGRSYARDLTDIAERFLPRRRESVAGVGVIRFRSSLGRRVQRILDSARELATHVSWKGVISICTITAVATLLVASLGMNSGSGKVDAAAADAEEDAGLLLAAGGNAEKLIFPAHNISSPTKMSTAMSPKEIVINKALETKNEGFTFDETPLEDVIEFFKMFLQFEDVNFLIYPDALRHDVFITIEMRDVSVRTALTAMLKPRGLDFMIWSDSIYISTGDAIKELRDEERQAAEKSVASTSESLEPPRTEREREIEALLQEKIESFSFDETPLRAIIGFLKMLPTFEGLHFAIDDVTLLDREVLITLTLSNVSLETALKSMLHPHGLGFAIMNDSIFISTEDAIERLRAEERQAAGTTVATASERLEPIRTEREREIEALLQEKMGSFDFDKTPLPDVIGFFRMLPAFEGLHFAIDDVTLLGREFLVTRQMSDVSLETALKNMLHPHGLGFAIMNDSIFISTKEGIRRRMPLILWTYNVKELFQPGGPLHSSPPVIDAGFLASTIYHVTGKENWDEFEIDGKSIMRQLNYKDGQGSGNSGNSGSRSTSATGLAFDSKATWAGINQSSALLVVNQRVDIHQQIEVILKKLRAAQKQGADKPVGTTRREVVPGGRSAGEEPVAPLEPRPRYGTSTQEKSKPGD